MVLPLALLSLSERERVEGFLAAFRACSSTRRGGVPNPWSVGFGITLVHLLSRMLAGSWCASAFSVATFAALAGAYRQLSVIQTSNDHWAHWYLMTSQQRRSHFSAKIYASDCGEWLVSEDVIDLDAEGGRTLVRPTDLAGWSWRAIGLNCYFHEVPSDCGCGKSVVRWRLTLSGWKIDGFGCPDDTWPLPLSSAHSTGR